MKKGNKILFLIIGIFGTVAFISIVLFFSLPKIIDSEIINKRVNAYLFEKTGGGITVEKSEIYLLPLPHIVLRQVVISIPEKTNGLIQSIDIYPNVWAIVRRDVKVSKISLESPRFTIDISEDKEKKSLEEIEDKMRSFMHLLNSVAPDVVVSVQDGKLDLTKGSRVAFSFDTIHSNIATSGQALKVSLDCKSNFWDTLSSNGSLLEEKLQSSGTVRMKNFRPIALALKFFPEIGKYAENSNADLSVKFDAIGLREVRAEVQSSVPDLVTMKGKERIEIKGLDLKGSVELTPARVSVILTEVGSIVPGLTLSGKYTFERTSGKTDIDVKAHSIDLKSVRTSALALAGDIQVIKTIFSYVRGGRIPALEFHTSGKSPNDLGHLENMHISGNLAGGDIYIPAKDLKFRNVSGDFIISNGILEGKNIKADIGNHQGSKGNVRVGLKGKDALFKLDMLVKADAGQLPAFLKEKHLVKNEAVLQEMDRLSDTRGTAEGRLILGDRLDSVHAVIDVSHLELVTGYEPLPFPLKITEGKVFFDEKRIKITSLYASLGNSSFSNVTAGLNLDDKADLEISDGKMKLAADELYPWITSYEKIKPVLEEVPSIQGAILISSVNLKGSLHHPEEWTYDLHGELKNVAVDSKFFPGKAEETSGAFRISDDELSLKDVRTRMADGQFTVTGIVSEFPSNIRNLDLSVQGNAGPKITAWMAGLIKLSPEISLRTPFSLSSSHLIWDEDAKTDFEGRLVFGNDTQVSLKLTRTHDTLSIHEISVKDRESDLTASVVLGSKTIDTTFKGILTPHTLRTIFTNNTFSGSSLRGDFRTHIILNDPKQSVAEGDLEGHNIPVPWKYDLPLAIQNISLESSGKSILVDTAEFSVGENQFRSKGSLDTSGEMYSIDMDLSSDGFDWETMEKIARGSQKAEKDNIQNISFDDIPLKGTVRMQLGYLKYRQFRWEPFHADVTFDGRTIHLRSKKAALCGISTTGTVDITPEGAEIDLALSAKKLQFQPTILCISDKKADITGRFDLKADIKAKGNLETIAKSLNGSFSISAKKGKIFKSQTLDKTLDLVNKTEDVKGALPDLNKTIIEYRSFTARGTMKKQLLEVEESMLDSSAFGIVAQGTVDLFSETVDFNALVAPLNVGQRVVKKVPVLGQLLGGSLVSIPVKIDGKLSDPQVTFLSPSAIGSAFLGIIERTIKLPITIIEPGLPGKLQE